MSHATSAAGRSPGPTASSVTARSSAFASATRPSLASDSAIGQARQRAVDGGLAREPAQQQLGGGVVVARGERHHAGVVVGERGEGRIAAALRRHPLLGDGVARLVQAAEAGQQLRAHGVQGRDEARQPADLGDPVVGAAQRLLVATHRGQDAGQVDADAVGAIGSRAGHPGDRREARRGVVEPVFGQRAERLRVRQLADHVGVCDVEPGDALEQRVGIVETPGDRRAPRAERERAAELHGVR